MRTTFAAQAASIQCPPWCVSDHRAGTDFLEHASRADVIATFRREPPLTVAVAQVTYLLSSPLDTPAVVRVGEHQLSPATARRMAACLVAAADLAEAGR